MPSRIVRRLIALLALTAFSVAGSQTGLVAACLPVDEACESVECMETAEMGSEVATAAASGEAQPADPAPAPLPEGSDCPLIAVGACVTAAPLPGSIYDDPVGASALDDGSGSDLANPLSRDPHGLLRPPIL